MNPFDSPVQILIVLLLALLIFGPKRIPEIGKGLGRGIRDFRKGVTGQIDDDDEDEDERPRPAKTPKRVAGSRPTATVTGDAEPVEVEIVEEDRPKSRVEA